MPISKKMNFTKKNFAGLFVIILLEFVLAGCRKSDYIVDEVVSIRDNGAGTGTTTWRNKMPNSGNISALGKTR
jgi:hypothetical protein